MHLPSVPSLFFLAYTLVFLPYLAVRSAHALERSEVSPQQEDGSFRWQAWRGTLISLVLLLALSILTASTFDYRWYALPSDVSQCVVASLISLSALLCFRIIVLRYRGEEERKKLFVYRMTARTRDEWTMKMVLAVLAGISEELAYRGVAMQILWYSTNNPWISAILISISFAIAHYVQGAKSMALIFLFALTMHALVAATNNLWGAIVVHVTYDMFAMWRISKKHNSLS